MKKSDILLGSSREILHIWRRFPNARNRGDGESRGATRRRVEMRRGEHYLIHFTTKDIQEGEKCSDNYLV